MPMVKDKHATIVRELLANDPVYADAFKKAIPQTLVRYDDNSEAIVAKADITADPVKPAAPAASTAKSTSSYASSHK